MDDERLLGRKLPIEQMQAHVPRTAHASIEQILSDLFALAVRTLVPGGRLVFLLPTTEPFSERLLPPHAGLVLEGQHEQVMAARWSRWCITMRRLAGGESGMARGTGQLNERTLMAVEPCSGARPAAAAPIFNRASLRPDDPGNASASGDAATAAVTEVLHPHLLGKSAGARKRLERRLARVACSSTASDGANHQAGDAASKGDCIEKGYGELCGTSTRAAPVKLAAGRDDASLVQTRLEQIAAQHDRWSSSVLMDVGGGWRGRRSAGCGRVSLHQGQSTLVRWWRC